MIVYALINYIFTKGELDSQGAIYPRRCVTPSELEALTVYAWDSLLDYDIFENVSSRLTITDPLITYISREYKTLIQNSLIK